MADSGCSMDKNLKQPMMIRAIPTIMIMTVTNILRDSISTSLQSYLYGLSKPVIKLKN